MGESFGIYKFGADESLMRMIDVANVACGFHGSDFNHMRKAVQLAKSSRCRRRRPSFAARPSGFRPARDGDIARGARQLRALSDWRADRVPCAEGLTSIISNRMAPCMAWLRAMPADRPRHRRRRRCLSGPDLSGFPGPCTRRSIANAATISWPSSLPILITTTAAI